MKRWYYKQRFLLAYRVLRNADERHRALSHNTNFVAMREDYVHFECIDCPDPRA